MTKTNRERKNMAFFTYDLDFMNLCSSHQVNIAGSHITSTFTDVVARTLTLTTLLELHVLLHLMAWKKWNSLSTSK